MSLLWMDGFDHYGTSTTGRTNMLAGMWAEVNSSYYPDTGGPVRTGTAAFRLDYSSGVSIARRIFGAAKTTAGVGFGLYLTNLPNSNKKWGWSFRDNDNADQVTVTISSTGGIELMRGSATGTILGTSADGVVVAEAWNHIETAVTISDTVGSVEVRINGVTVISVSGVDTKATSLTETSQWAIGTVATWVTVNSAVAYADDMFAWDSAGSSNNTFIGDRRVRTLYPSANTATAEWTANTGSAYDAINDTSPDGETTYISAGTTIPTTSEFDLDNLPASVAAVNAVMAVPYSRKEDAGDGNLQVSMLSSSSVAAGTDRPLTTTYTYWPDVFEVDPATSAPWTPSGVNAAKLRVRRTG